MEYPFDIEDTKAGEHPVFKRTFLQNTLAEMHFSSQVEDGKSRLNDLRTFVKNYFHISLGDDFDANRVLTLNNTDSDIMLHFADDFVGIRVGRKRYQSFATSVMPHVYLLKSYVQQVAKAEYVNSIVVRKINLWPVTSDGNKELEDQQLYEAVFSNLFLQQDTNKTEIDGLMMDVIDFERKETSLDLGRAIIKEPDQRVVVLNSKAVSQQTTPTRISDVETKMVELNGILFKAYLWCVNENIINMMKEV